MEKHRRRTRWSASLGLSLLISLPAASAGWCEEIKADEHALESEAYDAAVTPNAADILGSEEQAGVDWSKIFDAKGQLRAGAAVKQAVFMADDVSAGSKIDLTALAKDDNTLVRNAVVDKDQDIGNVYVALLPDSEGGLTLAGGIERLGGGDGHMTLEFNHDPVGLGAGGFGQNLPWEMTGSRTEGDILLRLNFADGQIASAEVSRWAGQPDSGSYQKVSELQAEGCANDGLLCAVSNSEDIPAGPWLNRDPDGVPSVISAHRFVEFKINAGVLAAQPAYTTVCALTSQDMVFDALKGGN